MVFLHTSSLNKKYIQIPLQRQNNTWDYFSMTLKKILCSYESITDNWVTLISASDWSFKINTFTLFNTSAHVNICVTDPLTQSVFELVISLCACTNCTWNGGRGKKHPTYALQIKIKDSLNILYQVNTMPSIHTFKPIAVNNYLSFACQSIIFSQT